MLDLNPGNNVSALERVERWEPSGGIFVPLSLIKIVSDGDQLRSNEVVSELLALAVTPVAGTAYPGCSQRN